ncbi:MAG: cysteine-rich repeat protein [Hyphomicrobiaceae bacterium]
MARDFTRRWWKPGGSGSRYRALKFRHALIAFAIHFFVTLFFVACLAPEADAVCGDLNDSGDVRASDALVCLRGAVGIVDLVGTCTPAVNCGPQFPRCGDINLNGRVLASDCLAILSAAVGARDISRACDCTGLQLCGNLVVNTDAGEECDDGNRESGDGCSPVCLFETPAVCDGVPTVAGTALAVEYVATVGPGITDLATAPGNLERLYVVLQEGLVRIVENGVLIPEAFLDVSSATMQFNNEDGLLGLAFHPQFESNGRFFVDYTDLEGDTVIARFEVSPATGIADPASSKELLRIGQIDPFHNGGRIVFGPDGFLWVAMGDGNGIPGGDTANQAQDDGSLLGKMLRLDVDVDAAPYWAVPWSNPDPTAAGTAEGALALIWGEGLRNPWRFSFDRLTGDLWIADVGQDAVEEINRVDGRELDSGPFQFGWNCCEGDSPFAGAGPECTYSCEEQVVPRRQLFHDGTGPEFCSITGGFVYRGCRMPDLHGSYFFADFCSGLFGEDAGGVTTVDRTAELNPVGGRRIDLPSAFGQDGRGELYIADYADGEVFRIIPAP